jgi:signal transduction histidine kinase
MRTAQPVVELDQIEREYAAVIALLDRSAAFRHAAALVPAEAGIDVGFAAERIDDLDTLSVCAVSGNHTDALLELVIPAGMGLSGKVATLRHPIVVSDYLREPGITHDFDPQWRAEGLRAAVAVPVSRGHWFYGVLCGAAREPGDIPDRTIDALMRLARQTGLAIEVADHAREMADVAVHEERRHLALTIHDSVGAILFSIGAAARDLETERECEPALRARLKFIEQQVAKASAQLRSALRSLNEVPQEVSLGVALRSECRALEERTGMKAGPGGAPQRREARPGPVGGGQPPRRRRRRQPGRGRRRRGPRPPARRGRRHRWEPVVGPRPRRHRRPPGPGRGPAVRLHQRGRRVHDAGLVAMLRLAC